MSHTYYNNKFFDAQHDLNELLQREAGLEEQKSETVSFLIYISYNRSQQRNVAFQQLATLYIEYLQVFRKLDSCYDQIVHPQKRVLLRTLVDSVCGRLLEVKNEMVNLEFSEYSFFDDVLSDLKLTTTDLELPLPHYFVAANQKAVEERKAIILNYELTNEKDETAEEGLNEIGLLSRNQAIIALQRHERCRQGKVRSIFSLEVKIVEENERQAGKDAAEASITPDEAVTTISKYIRGNKARKQFHEQSMQELVWLGMDPNAAYQPSEAQLKAEKTAALRRVTQNMHTYEYEQALVTIKDKIREVEAPDIREGLQEQIRQWFLECRDITGKFPDLPEQEDGGSAAIFKEKTPEELEQQLKEKEEAGDKGKKGKKGKKEKKKKEKKDKKGKKNKKGKDGGEEGEEGWKIAESKFLPQVRESCHNYETLWKFRNESRNHMQRHDVELIKESKRLEVEEEIRLQVDELMRQELRNLKLAIDKEKVKKGKKKKKKGGKKGGKKGKKEKDLTPDATVESLFEELVEEGIIKRPSNFKMTDFFGEYNYLGTTLRQANIEPQPSLSDVRRAVSEYGILPLGSPEVHERAPLVRSMLLAGPSGTGKTALVSAICNATGANLFDLTAANIAGKYPGKDGLKMLLHLVFKVGRLLQPSVIMIDKAEMMFKKKVPKTDVTDPKRLKKALAKAMKGIKADDRILLVGCTNAPFEGEVKAMCGLYQKILLIPRPDYASRMCAWRRKLLEHGGRLTQRLDLHSLTKISDGYTIGHIDSICRKVLVPARVAELEERPLTALEFIKPLSRVDPVYAEEEEAFKAWYRKTPMGKKREKMLAEESEVAAGGGGGTKKKGKKKKGKKKKKK